jgi:hypothetical protein
MSVVPILIANWRGGEMLQLCIESIWRFTPQGGYRVIVCNDHDQLDTDGPYLRTARDRGWLTLIEPPERLHHGGVLNVLWNDTDLGDAEFAVNLDNDTQVTDFGWLGDLLSGFRSPETLGVSDLREHNCVSNQGYIPPMYRFWYGALSVPLYRELGPVDWRFAYADRREYPYSEMFKDVENIHYSQKDSPEFRSECVALDPGSKLWVKVRYENPKGYKIVPVPANARAKHHHIGHVSHMVELPDDYDAYTRAHKQNRRKLIAEELRRLRCPA